MILNILTTFEQIWRGHTGRYSKFRTLSMEWPSGKSYYWSRDLKSEALALSPKMSFLDCWSSWLKRLQGNQKENLISGFKKYGIVPVSAEAIKRRLPSHEGNISTDDLDASVVSQTVSLVVTDTLNEMRYRIISLSLIHGGLEVLDRNVQELYPLDLMSTTSLYEALQKVSNSWIVSEVLSISCFCTYIRLQKCLMVCTLYMWNIKTLQGDLICWIS